MPRPDRQVNLRDGGYHVSTLDLGTYLVPKREQPVTVEPLHASGRGIGYTRSPFAHLFTGRE